MGFLSGYRVLDLTDERGLIAGRMLADLGADVVQVEPPGGSTARTRAPLLDGGESLYFDAYAANKRGVVADRDTAAGRALVADLAAAADVLIESADPGAMAALGLDYPDLSPRNPGLVYASVTAFGRTGPKAGYAASDITLWAAGGPLDPHRDGDRPPLRISVPQSYLHAGADAAAGALLALHARVRTGRGQHVDVAAQASLGFTTLARVLAAAVGDDESTWAPPPSPSGANAPQIRRKWMCLDGMVEFAVGVGPIAGAFTESFMRWMVETDGADPALLELDWRSAPDPTRPGPDIEAIQRDVGTFLAKRSKEEILQAATERKLLCVPVYDTGDVANSPQLAAREFWAEVGEGARRRRLPGPFAAIDPEVGAFDLSRPAPLVGEHTDEVIAQWLAEPSSRAVAQPAVELSAAQPATLPLDGLKVLDLSWVVAGPMIGRALADFGATVIRVESSTRIETARQMMPWYGGVRGPQNSSLYVTCNAGKLGMTIDLQTDQGRDIVRRLAAWSDVVVESFSPGLLSRWGLDYASLSAGREDLIMLSTSLMGQTGPYARLAGYGNVGAALSGFQDAVGWPDRPAVGPFGPYTDYLGPRCSIATLLSALDRRRRTGLGCYIDVAQVEAGVFFLSPELAHYHLTGAIVQRMGNADRDFAPHGVYRCADEDGASRFAAIAATSDEQWAALARVIGRPDLTADPQLANAQGRSARAADLDAAIGAWTASRWAADVERELQAAGVASHVSATSADFCSDPQLIHRGHLVSVPDPLHGTAVVEGPRYLLSDTPGVVARSAPIFGQDNAYVLTEILGMSDQEVAELDALGVLR